MTRNEFFLACFLVFLILVGVAYRARVGGGGAFNPVLITSEAQDNVSGLFPADIPPVTALVNINRAAADDLTAIPAVDRKCAENIVAFRQRYGRFSDLRELMEVSGIDRSRYERLRPYVRLTDLGPLLTPTPGSTSGVSARKPEGAFGAVIGDGGKRAVRLPGWLRPGAVTPRVQPGRDVQLADLNKATLADLKAVDGIGDVLAGRILEARAQRGGFRSWQEVEAVDGIGKTRLESLRKQFVLPQH